ncbi:nuclear transport factor 2 family protein [Thiothrix lacustris]|uniref:nuclear transport factor 2 family protein n=1 Tax=Thiothrix lacustris TaxID=525917 RepID=UPI00355B8EC7
MVSIEETVVTLERELLNPAIRSDHKRLNELLADDFLEVGASGRSYCKADVLSILQDETDTSFTVTAMQAHLLAPNVALLTYLATRSVDGQTTHSRRSSVWVYSACGWQIRYQQGTNCAPVAA